jgi:hypothetical protein
LAEVDGREGGGGVTTSLDTSTAPELTAEPKHKEPEFSFWSIFFTPFAVGVAAGVLLAVMVIHLKNKPQTGDTRVVEMDGAYKVERYWGHPHWDTVATHETLDAAMKSARGYDFRMIGKKSGTVIPVNPE